MQISLIYILIVAELLLMLLGLSLTLAIMLLRKPKVSEEAEDAEAPPAENTELSSINLGNNYLDFLEQAIEDNDNKLKQLTSPDNDLINEQNNELPEAEENSINSSEEEATELLAIEDSDATDIIGIADPTGPIKAHSALLQARQQFLLIEKKAAQHVEQDANFWNDIYADIETLLEQYKTTETIHSESTSTEIQTESTDKVFYIETQGKKVGTEVNKLKDIISEQENALSSMKKALEGAEEEHPEDSASLALLREQLAVIETQLNDSKMCMGIMEMENDRLQEEINKMQIISSDSEQGPSENTTEPNIDLEQMREVAAAQESKIQKLIDTIDSLKLDAEQTEKLKETLNEFAHSSKEMMGCIAILEEENERLSSSEEAETTSPESAAEADSSEDEQTKINELEEELIKKDVAYAQLQDEFNSMETEYLAMYEAMHGDNS